VAARLQRAALELFRERGYDRTTAAEIAERAFVTERTFFRYFPDKREVLFVGQAQLLAALAASIEGAPGDLGAIDILFRAFRSVLTLLEGNRPFAQPRHEVISATPALRERELAKHASLADSLAELLKKRGVGELQATLAAQTGMAAFVDATVSWLNDPNLELGERLDLALKELKTMMSTSTNTSSGKRRSG
jgi:AcrR family transcriptional regulator